MRKVHFRSRGLKIATFKYESSTQSPLSQLGLENLRKVKYRFRGRRSTFARSSAKFVAGAALSQGQVQNSWQAHHFRKVKYRICGRCSTFARSSAKFVARAALSQGQVQISWQAQHFRKVKYRFRGRRSTFARSSIDFVAGAALSQGQVSISWQAQHFRKHSLRAGGWQDAENVGSNVVTFVTWAFGTPHT